MIVPTASRCGVRLSSICNCNLGVKMKSHHKDSHWDEFLTQNYPYSIEYVSFNPKSVKLFSETPFCMLISIIHSS